VILVVILYVFTAQLGHLFELVDYAVSLVWPASGVALATILIYGPKVLPAIIIAIVIEEAIQSTPLAVIPGMAFSGAGGAIIAWWGMIYVRRFNNSIENVSGLMSLLLWGAIIGPLFSAINGIAWLYLSGVIDTFSVINILYWWMGGALGVLLLVPPLLLWADNKYTATKHNQRYLAWMATILLGCVLVFTNVTNITFQGQNLSPVIFFPLIVWGAYYVGLSAVYSGVFLIFMSAFSSHFLGVGYYASIVGQVPIELWFFVTTLSVTGLSVGASNIQREQAEWKAASSRMHDLLSDTSLSLQQLLQMQCDEVVDDVSGCYSAVLLLNDNATELNLAAHHELPDEFIFNLESISLNDEHSPMAYCLNKGAMISSLEKKEIWLTFEQGVTPWGGGVCVPILNLFRQPLGVLCIFYQSSARFQLADLQRHQRAAYQCSLLTVRKRSEIALAEKQLETENERALLRSMINANPDLIFIKNVRHQYILCNNAFEQLSGMNESDILGKNHEDVFGCEIDPFIAEMDSKILTLSSAIVREELWIRYPDGKKVLIDLVKAPLKDSEDNIYGVIGLGRDITLRRELEAELIAMTEDQQRVIGQELHDGVGQKLVGLAFHAKLLEQQVSPELTQAVSALANNVNEIIADIRNLARGLLPIELESNGLSAALESLAKNISSTFSITCLYEVKKEVLLNEQIKSLNLYRITQEALTNAIRHGEATEIIISLQGDAEKIVLSIKDNGCGFDVDQYQNGTIKGIGLKSMQYRASLIRADLKFLQPEGGGFEVEVSLKTGAGI